MEVVQAVRKQLSIVHVIRSPVGGVLRHVADLASTQREAGHSVGLICDRTAGSPLDEERIAALEAGLDLGVVRFPMRRAPGAGDMSAALAVARAVARLMPDIVHAHGAKGGVYGRVAAALQRRRGHIVAAFYAPHGGSLHYGVRSVSGQFFFTVERALERVTDGLIHVSAYEAATYRRKVGTPRCPAHVVPNGLRPEEFEPVACGPGAADFLVIGELRDLKGVDVFIEALGRLHREGRRRHALIVGRGTPQDEVRYRGMVAAAGLVSHVRFHPPLAARRAFALARAVVVPSRAESLPYLVLEAAAAGVPLIATNVGGIPEIFEGGAGRLVAAGDPDALAAAMRDADDSPARLAGEAMLRREHVRQKFSLDAMTARIEGIYRPALEERYRMRRASPVPATGFSR